jgi:23S rRNA (uracil1939-C5)-methyltransferase
MRSGRASAQLEPELVTVAALNHDGEGVVRSGKTAFVAGALPGETIRMLRRRHHRQHDEADLLEVVTPAPERVAPRCPHFGTCGGCALQHLAPEAQLAAKHAELVETLARVGHVAPEAWLAPLAGPVWNYRRRARLGAKFVDKRGRVLVGFRERQKPYVAALEGCEILAQPVDRLIAPLSALLTGLSAPRSVPQIEVAVGEAATALVFRCLEEPTEGDRAQFAEFERTHGVRVYLQRGGPATVVPLHEPAPRLHYCLPQFALELEFLPVDFLQVNAGMNRLLVARALELLGAAAGDHVLDLFCGLGNFTLALARGAATVTGVEGEAGLVERARRNAAANGIDNVQFHVANLAAVDAGAASPGVASAAWASAPFTHVLIDPPRAGALELLPWLARLAPRRIVYVSCHPASLARDLGVLCQDHGMVLKAAGVVDMFPHTTHVESIAVLEPGRRRRA